MKSSDQKYKAFFDGSSKPNPGEMTIGGFIEDQNGERICGFRMGMGSGTNNVAEYLAIIEVLEEAIRQGIRRIEIFGDSQLVVNQVNNKWKSNQSMTPYKEKVQKLLSKFNKWSLTHIKRELNSEADFLTR